MDLLNHGYDVVSIDNFSNSTDENFDAIEKLTGKRVKNYPIDLCELDKLEEVLDAESEINSVIHFAAYKYVGESASEPLNILKIISTLY